MGLEAQTSEWRKHKVKMKIRRQASHLKACRWSLSLAIGLLALFAAGQLISLVDRHRDTSARRPAFAAGAREPDSEELEPERELVGPPRFASNLAKVIVGSRWQNQVVLPCKVLDLDDEQTVSWIRKRDSLVLTIDKLRLIDDARFQLAQDKHDWTLVLSEPNDLDAGFYECQVSSMEPKLSHLVQLRLVEATSRLNNRTAGDTMFVRPGERVNLTCQIEAPQATDFVYWYKNKEPILFDNLRVGGQSRRADQSMGQLFITAQQAAHQPSSGRPQLAQLSQLSHEQRQAHESDQHSQQQSPGPEPLGLVHSRSSLLIKQATPNDTANYTCLPSNTRPSHVNVIVLQNPDLQSQPEKRSLEAADGAHSAAHQVGQLWRLTNRLIQRIIPWIQVEATTKAAFNIQGEQMSLAGLLELAANEQLQRLLITILTMVLLFLAL